MKVFQKRYYDVFQIADMRPHQNPLLLISSPRMTPQGAVDRWQTAHRIHPGGAVGWQTAHRFNKGGYDP